MFYTIYHPSSQDGWLCVVFELGSLPKSSALTAEGLHFENIRLVALSRNGVYIANLSPRKESQELAC